MYIAYCSVDYVIKFIPLGRRELFFTGKEPLQFPNFLTHADYEHVRSLSPIVRYRGLVRDEQVRHEVCLPHLRVQNRRARLQVH